MNKKSILTPVIIFVFATMAFAQNYRPATPEQQKELTQNIAAASKQMKTLRCDFVQKKSISILADELLSEGKLLFKQTDKLCWEYTKPYQYRFMLNGNKMMMGTNNIDVNSSKVFNEISKMIVSSINGTGIFDENKFVATFNVGIQNFQVALMPKQKELKQLFSNITLTFNKPDYSVDTVEIKEISGDATFITMKNKRINQEINDAIFDIR
jgi:outer membrane lipoprotein carrier protein